MGIRPELLQYRDGDELLCVRSNDKDFDVSDTYVVSGGYLNDSLDRVFTIVTDYTTWRIVENYLNGTNIMKDDTSVLMVRKDLLTEEDKFHGELSGWKV